MSRHPTLALMTRQKFVSVSVHNSDSVVVSVFISVADQSPDDAPKVCQFRRVAKDVKDDWCDIMRLLDTANDERFLSEVGPDKGFFSDLVCPAFVRRVHCTFLCD